jgi:hypothetical protein
MTPSANERRALSTVHIHAAASSVQRTSRSYRHAHSCARTLARARALAGTHAARAYTQHAHAPSFKFETPIARTLPARYSASRARHESRQVAPICTHTRTTRTICNAHTHTHIYTHTREHARTHARAHTYTHAHSTRCSHSTRRPHCTRPRHGPVCAWLMACWNYGCSRNARMPFVSSPCSRPPRERTNGPAQHLLPAVTTTSSLEAATAPPQSYTPD